MPPTTLSNPPTRGQIQRSEKRRRFIKGFAKASFGLAATVAVAIAVRKGIDLSPIMDMFNTDPNSLPKLAARIAELRDMAGSNSPANEFIDALSRKHGKLTGMLRTCMETNEILKPHTGVGNVDCGKLIGRYTGDLGKAVEATKAFILKPH